MSGLKLFTFGGPRLERGGEPIDLKLRKATALFVYLGVTRREYSRDELATLLWPESDQSSARANLRRTLYTINRSVGENLLTSSRDTISLNPQHEIWTDVETFRHHIEECMLEDESSNDIDSRCISHLEEAVGIYQGDFLAGFTLPDCPAFDEWVFFESESLREMLSAALQKLASAYETNDEFDHAIEHTRHWLNLDNLHEPAHQRLMVLYASAGKYAAALRQYQECERVLDQELGVLPSAETTELYDNIRLHRAPETLQPVKVRPEVKYIPSGDVHIAYTVFGDGPVDLIWIVGYITHQEHLWELPDWVNFFEELSSFSRVILFDRRGVGLSDRVGYAPTLDDTMDDILAVMQAAGSKHAVLFGYLEGGPNSMLFSATYPERVSGLILYGTCAKWTRTENYPWAITNEQFDRWIEIISENWGAAINLELYTPSRANDPQMQNWWAKFMRLASSPGGMKDVLEVMREIDVRHILPTIRTPTLIMHRSGDRAIRIGAARYLAGQIPGAKYVEFEGDDHWFFIGDSQPILQEIKLFIQNLGSPVIPERMLATILLIETIGEPENTDAIYAFLHQEVGRYRGSEVSWSEGRYTATFDGPSRAIHCARNILASADQREIPLRAGLHTGECEFVAGDLVGSAVQIAECVLDAAEAHEILASGTVKDLVVGSRFEFTERGHCAIEGVEGEWGIFNVV
jgi:DNA-binding SARP family transcriptional activator